MSLCAVQINVESNCLTIIQHKYYFGASWHNLPDPMESTLEPVSARTCDNCTAAISTEKFCTSCGFPVNGTEEEKTEYKGKIIVSQFSLQEAEEKIRKARNIIYILAGLTFLGAMITGIANDDYPTMMANLVICLLYLILAYWANKNPFGAILTCFIVYLTLQIVLAILAPATIVSGILWKVIFIGAFIKGIQSASEAQKLMKQLEQYKRKPLGAE